MLTDKCFCVFKKFRSQETNLMAQTVAAVKKIFKFGDCYIIQVSGLFLSIWRYFKAAHIMIESTNSLSMFDRHVGRNEME